MSNGISAIKFEIQRSFILKTKVDLDEIIGSLETSCRSCTLWFIL